MRKTGKTTSHRTVKRAAAQTHKHKVTEEKILQNIEKNSKVRQ